MLRKCFSTVWGVLATLLIGFGCADDGDSAARDDASLGPDATHDAAPDAVLPDGHDADAAPDTLVEAGDASAAEAGCECELGTSSFGSDPSNVACLCPKPSPVPCFSSYEEAVGQTGLLCTDWTITVSGPSSGCSGPMWITFNHGCLEGSTLFYDRTSHGLVGVAYFSDEGSPCSTDTTFAGTTTTDTCGSCVLCGPGDCIGQTPLCNADAG